jgi:hypothetical protein
VRHLFDHSWLIGEYVLHVAEASKKAPQPTREPQARQRRRQGAAVAALHLPTSVAAADRGKLGFVTPDKAMGALARAVDNGTLRIPRLFVLDALVKLSSRRGSLEGYDKLDELLEALVRRAGVPTINVTDAADTVRQALDSVSQLEGGSSNLDRWSVFAAQTADVLQLTTAEVEKPSCNDGEDVKKGSQGANGVTVEFYTDATPSDLRDFCDPRLWHEHSAYQRKMSELGGSKDNEKLDNGWWRHDLLEIVELSPEMTLETPLRFTFSIQDKDNPRWVHLDYVLIDETKEISIDEGSLDVRLVTTGIHKGRTRVIAKKAILFTDQLLQDWTTIACDTFWTEMVIAAAVGSSTDGGGPPTQGGQKMASTDADKLNKVIDEAAQTAQKSVTTYSTIAKEAAKRLTGNEPVDPGAWMKLSAKAYAQATGDTARAWTTWNKAMNALAEQK